MSLDEVYAAALEYAWQWRRAGDVTEAAYRDFVQGAGARRMQNADDKQQKQARNGAAVNPTKGRW